ncbi:flagella basal body P-ring formation protein FlgA [candidate division WOR-1 bacterium RIFCSPLOWO2_02_FULL_46_20]|uniref:Flagella basal body P-ring formation protein FlgA n=2 Tax=Saganbacteria TaxID=1703751 RepID=A0A1F4RDL0_UNCSA|nr:MAG: flagella basal body P-ring formation protein FlgA [candidate division WOR-1 bacterium RIFCSPHIGHO2_02_FULL_45_12]OGC06269.1 MAG: flagella basal body P-ring formation protein FlgA [candidate division WOR-1 bacterium RIFCSPLOWO2_02_FULL_46_20]OGC08624.1 MAG: flagella basal body P-ring formation protein FlgA [candidate division WOR-1 bacterium RIFCSPLOWO2_12_FULL_45_9]
MKNVIVAFLVVILSFSVSALNNPEGKIAQVIENYVTAKYPAWSGLDIRVTFKYADKLFEQLSGYNEEVGLEVVEVYKDFKPVGNVIFPIRVTAGDESRKVFVRASVEVFKEIVVVKNKIDRASRIEAKDLTLAERDVAMLPQKYYSQIDQIANSEAKTTISQNSTIFEWMIKQIPVVRRGDEVAVVVSGPNLLVKSKGVALMDGYINKELRVKVNKNTLDGVLVSKDEVEVTLK